MKISPEQLEKYSSAMTLSDMEVFVFPELMYSLVLANIMSPIIWRWRELDCFKKIKSNNSYKKLMRLRQYVMDEYDFNLDLETWGLTTKEREFKRFEKYIPPQEIAKSNALFGYEGDKYYFDVDIRKHFGLDKYNDEIIPYWKTETVEAMDAFPLREGYSKAAGECVSLATLYAAAAFVVCGIPFEDIYMILTPLHSQNFIDLKDGVLTNNRRVITKTMWFNGTAITAKAQRALRNEQATVVAHNSGYVHCLYKDATINKNAYQGMSHKLKKYLSTEITTFILVNFLRYHPEYQKYFQFCCEECRGGPKFAKTEVLFQYEQGSSLSIAEDTFHKMIEEVSDQEILSDKMPDRICCEQLYKYIAFEGLDIKQEADRKTLKKFVAPFIPEADQFLSDLLDFIYVEPKLPEAEKNFIPSEPIEISADWTREQIIDYLQSIRAKNATADLAFYAYRDMETCDWNPFVKAAIERNPVSIDATKSMTIDEIYQQLIEMRNSSIYEGKRLAQPDEVSNYQTGDGVEKAFLLANIIHDREPEQKMKINVNNIEVSLQKGQKEYKFESAKDLQQVIDI